MRWPVIHALFLAIGIAFGVGGFFLFGTVDLNERKATFVKGVGILMVVVYGWLLSAFVARCARGTWTSHCQDRIAEFEGL